MTRTTRMLAAMMIAGVGLTVLSGCTPAREATVLETPSMSWQGAEPAFGLEDEPAVQYLRAYFLGQALAWNTGDFTLELLNSTTEVDQINYLSRQYAKQGDLPSIFRGPKAFEPISILDVADTPLSVTVCDAVGADYLTELDPYADEVEHTVRQVTYALHETGVAGYEISTRVDVTPGDEYPGCVGVVVPVALFDTPPTMPDTPVTAAVREPLQSGDE